METVVTFLPHKLMDPSAIPQSRFYRFLAAISYYLFPHYLKDFSSYTYAVIIEAIDLDIAK